MSDKIRLDYSNTTDYSAVGSNVVGASTSTTLRTVTTHDDTNCRYVRKFGDAYLIKQVTDIEDPVDADMKFWVYALDGTLLGSRVGGGAFVAGTTLSTAQASYLKVTATGACTMLTTVLIDTDVDTGGIDFVCPAEVLTNGMSINLYLSSTTSTYYDEDLIYGGARHTPDGTEALPYFKIQTALDACDSYFPICTVLDSAIYDEEITIDGAWTLQSALGQTPTITCGIGARVTRDVQHDGNNLDTAYVSKLGNDSTGTGTWALPYLTISKAVTDIGTRTYINIKDSGTYIENLTVENIEPIYGALPSLVGYSTGTGFIAGLTIDSIGFDYSIYSDTDNFKAHDNIIFTTEAYDPGGNVRLAGITVKGVIDVKRNIIKGTSSLATGTAGIQIALTSSGSVEKNIISNCLSGIVCLLQIDGDTGNNSTIIKNNTTYNCSTGVGIGSTQIGSTATTQILNNTYFNCLNGISIGSGSMTFSGTIKNCICWGSTGLDGNADIRSSQNITVSYMNYLYKTVNVTANNSITTDPLFIDTTENNFALKVTSGAYKTGDDTGDMGSSIGCVLISASDAIINGFIIDGQNKYNYGIYKTGSTDYTGLIVKWNDVINCLGVGIDDYGSVATNGTIINNDVNNNGNGVLLRQNTTSFDYNIIHNNIIYGVYSDNVMTSFNHNTIFSNGIAGLYIPLTSIYLRVKNSIFYGNGAYGINSLVYCAVKNSCINDYVSSLVDYLPSSNANITDNPLFVNENEGEEDFHLKSVARGYLFNSPCLNLADDGYDMGAYIETLTVTGGGWKTYQLDNEPASLNIETALKEGNTSISNFGDMFLRGRNFKMVFPMIWNPDSATTATQSKKIRYFQTLIPTIKNELKRLDTLFRIWFLPETHLETGTGTIDGTLKTILNNSASWVENEWNGFWVGVKHNTVTDGVINATTKQVTLSGAGWTTDEHAGRYFRVNQIPYLILSNTSTILQLSDPNSYLTSETASGFIETYYKVDSNTSNTLTVLDPLSTLPTGSYSYYFAFVRAYVSSQAYRYEQPNYSISNGTWKSGYTITFEEE